MGEVFLPIGVRVVCLRMLSVLVFLITNLSIKLLSYPFALAICFMMFNSFLCCLETWVLKLTDVPWHGRQHVCVWAGVVTSCL